MVICDICGSEHEAIFESTNQGCDCSASVLKDGIVGHYGSTVIDMQYWTWTTGMPLHIKRIFDKHDRTSQYETNICDECIKGLIDNKLIELNKTGIW